MSVVSDSMFCSQRFSSRFRWVRLPPLETVLRQRWPYPVEHLTVVDGALVQELRAKQSRRPQPGADGQ